MITETLNNLLHQTAFFNLDWGNYVMIAVACFFLYLAIKHEFEPLLCTDRIRYAACKHLPGHHG